MPAESLAFEWKTDTVAFVIDGVSVILYEVGDGQKRDLFAGKSQLSRTLPQRLKESSAVVEAPSEQNPKLDLQRHEEALW